jgi:hypothetical protein
MVVMQLLINIDVMNRWATKMHDMMDHCNVRMQIELDRSTCYIDYRYRYDMIYDIECAVVIPN